MKSLPFSQSSKFEFFEKYLHAKFVICFLFRVIEFKSSKDMDDFQVIDFQYILSQLFEMIQKYDFADEMGRKALKELLMKLLAEQKLSATLIRQSMEILSKITEIEALCNEIVALVADIHEPLVVVPRQKDDSMQNKFKVSCLLNFSNRVRKLKQISAKQSIYLLYIKKCLLR